MNVCFQVNVIGTMDAALPDSAYIKSEDFEGMLEKYKNSQPQVYTRSKLPAVLVLHGKNFSSSVVYCAQ